MSEHEHRPGRVRDIKRATLAHNVAHGLIAIKSNIHAVRKVTEKPFAKITSEDWAGIAKDVRVLDHEITCQVFDSLNLIACGAGTQRSGQGRHRVERRWPISLLEEMLPDYEAQALDRGISITVKDEAETPVNIDLDVNMVRHAFHNALTNAVKYSYRGSPTRLRFVHVRGTVPKDYESKVTIEFENFGIGIEPDELDAVWEHYKRGRIAEREATQGSGLGLPQIRECMAFHHGTATLTSEPQTNAPVASPIDVPYKTTLRLEFPMETRVRSRYKP